MEAVTVLISTLAVSYWALGMGWRSVALCSFVIVLSGFVFWKLFALPKTNRNQVSRFLDNLSVGGHRGSAADAPENTMEALEYTQENGADAVEFDLEFSKDNVAILFHDDTLDRTTDGSGRVSDFSWDQIKKLNAAAKFNGTKKYTHAAVPTLQQAVDFCVDKKLKIFFDVKAPDHRAVNVLMEMYKKHTWLYDNSAVCSFYPWVVYKVKEADPGIITGHTWRRGYYAYRDIACTTYRSNSAIKQLFSSILDSLNIFSLHSWIPSITGADLMLINRLQVSQNYVSEVRSQGMNVVVWTVNDPFEKLYLRNLKIPYLTDKISTVPKVDENGHII